MPEPSKPWFGMLATSARHKERVYDDFAIQPLLPNKLSLEGPALACGDLDGDGRQDFSWEARREARPSSGCNRSLAV